MPKHIFITGGVVSSLGKGITSASLALLLKRRGYRVAMQKLDPYLNVDPGTMSPFQHGEVFVTDDGAETDLDLGHYERFTDINCSKASNYTTGKIYSSVIARERAGEYLGKTVQVIPHITDEIKRAIRSAATDDVRPVLKGCLLELEGEEYNRGNSFELKSLRNIFFENHEIHLCIAFAIFYCAQQRLLCDVRSW